MKVIELLLSNLHLLHAQPCSAAGRSSGHRPSLDVLSSPFNPWESAILRHRDWEDGKGRRQIQQSSKKLCRPCVQDLKIIKISQGFTRHLTKLQNSWTTEREASSRNFFRIWVQNGKLLLNAFQRKYSWLWVANLLQGCGSWNSEKTVKILQVRPMAHGLESTEECQIDRSPSS